MPYPTARQVRGRDAVAGCSRWKAGRILDFFPNHDPCFVFSALCLCVRDKKQQRNRDDNCFSRTTDNRVRQETQRRIAELKSRRSCCENRVLSLPGHAQNVNTMDSVSKYGRMYPRRCSNVCNHRLCQGTVGHTGLRSEGVLFTVTARSANRFLCLRQRGNNEHRRLRIHEWLGRNPCGTIAAAC